jgi:hypothetical protein
VNNDLVRGINIYPNPVHEKIYFDGDISAVDKISIWGIGGRQEKFIISNKQEKSDFRK